VRTALAIITLSLSGGLLLTGCSEPDQDPSPSAAPLDGAGSPTELKCGDDVDASFRFLGPETLELTLNGETHILEQQRTASGARYAGDDIDFWNKGSESMLTIGEHRYTCTEPL